MAETVARIGAYVRLSLDKDGKQTATARQLAAIKKWCRYKGWSIYEVYEDVDLSASKAGVVRPAYERMLRDLESGVIDGVVVWKFDRLMRRPAEFERFWSYCEPRGGVLVSINENFDTSTPLGLAMVRILIIFASLEADNTSVRLCAKIVEQAEGGVPPFGPAPYGFRKVDNTYEIHEEEAARIRDAVSRVLAGQSLTGLASEWRAAGIPTPRNAKAMDTGGRVNEQAVWRVSSVRCAILNPALAGLRVLRGEVIGTGNWPPILDRDTQAAVSAMLNDPSRRLSSQNARKHLLSGFLRCVSCEQKMVATKAGKYLRYGCAPRLGGCGRVSIDRSRADSVVLELVVRAAAEPTAAPSGARFAPRLAEVAQDLAVRRARLAELGQSFAAGLPMEVVRSASATLNAEIEALELEFAKLSRDSSATALPKDRDACRAYLAEQSVEVRRASILSILDRVDVLPRIGTGNTFNPARLVPIWRDGLKEDAA